MSRVLNFSIKSSRQAKGRFDGIVARVEFFSIKSSRQDKGRIVGVFAPNECFSIKSIVERTKAGSMASSHVLDSSR